jgi:UDP-2,4-diacetamido-2,4,6-trideoxy-beta-L-altropyranose hydrolase
MTKNRSQLTKLQNGPAVLFIRADANTRMGTGHIMRCIALGQAWLDAVQRSEVRGQPSAPTATPSQGNSGGKVPSLKPKASSLTPLPSVVFICAEIPDVLAERVRSQGFDLIRINADLGSPEDLGQTLDIISSFKSQVSSFIPPSALRSHPSSLSPDSGLKFQISSFKAWLVTDGYHFNLDYQRGMRAAGCKLLLIDDYNHLPEYEADILLNQNIGAEEIEYRCNPECRKMLGTQYVMLRREFRTLEKRTQFSPGIGPERSERGPVIAGQRPEGSAKHLLVTLGGADPDNVTLKVINALSQLELPDLQVKVVVGPANPHLDSLRQAISSSTINCELINSVRDMPGLMDWADFAITAAGSTCWELAVLGVPFITVILAENQEQVAQMLAKMAGIPCAGWADEGLGGRVVGQIEDGLLTGPVARPCPDFVDRFGVDRILYKPAADSRLDYYTSRLVLRPISMDDAQHLFDWANDPATRKNSFNSEPILWAAHVEWLQKKLTDSSARLFMLELDGVVCGHIRYQLEKTGDALLSFVVAPGFRGMGIGDALVMRSRSVICKQWPSCRIKALTLQVNRASLSIFRKNSFLEELGLFEGKRTSLFYWSCTNHEE